MGLAKTEMRRLWLEGGLDWYDDRLDGSYPDSILGFDLSLRKTGYVVLDHEGEVQTTGRITTDSQESEVVSIRSYSEQLDQLFDQYQPEMVAWESVTAGGRRANFRAKKQLSMALALVMERLQQEDVRPMMVFPSSKGMQKFVTGSGKSGKAVTLKEVYKRWGVDLDEDDIADAFGIARMAYDLCFLVSRFCYLREDCSFEDYGDLSFLMDFEKGRLQDAETLSLESNLHSQSSRLTQYQHEALVSMFMPKKPYERGPRVMKWNDFDHYQKLKQRVKTRHDDAD